MKTVYRAWGHSKNKRPDLAQVKIMLATLDPLALPVASEVLSGEKADDPLYVPAIKRVRETLLRNGLLYIGDCKMAAISKRSASRRATRGELEAGGDYYLCPLPATQLATGELLSYLQPVWSGIQQLTEVESSNHQRASIKTLSRPTCPSDCRIDNPAFCDSG